MTQLGAQLNHLIPDLKNFFEMIAYFDILLVFFLKSRVSLFNFFDDLISGGISHKSLLIFYFCVCFGRQVRLGTLLPFQFRLFLLFLIFLLAFFHEVVLILHWQIQISKMRWSGAAVFRRYRSNLIYLTLLTYLIPVVSKVLPRLKYIQGMQSCMGELLITDLSRQQKIYPRLYDRKLQYFMNSRAQVRVNLQYFTNKFPKFLRVNFRNRLILSLGNFQSESGKTICIERRLKKAQLKQNNAN